MRDIAVLICDGAYAGSLGAVIDAHALMAEIFLSNPAMRDYARLQTRLRLVNLTGKPARLAGGRSLAMDTTIGTDAVYRLIVLPAFQLATPGDIDAALSDFAAIHDWLRHQRSRDAVIGASGASVFHIAQAGLLNGCAVCVQPRLAGDFHRLFPHLRVAPQGGLSASGPIMTCAELHLERLFATRLFEQGVSPEAALWLALRQGLEAETAFPSDPLVTRAQHWIRERFTHPIRIGDLACHLAVSHQTLTRRFQRATGETPKAYAQRVRVGAAATMLRETLRPVAEIAPLVGYADLRSFREVFMKQTGFSPAAFRAQTALRQTRAATSTVPDLPRDQTGTLHPPP